MYSMPEEHQMKWHRKIATSKFKESLFSLGDTSELMMWSDDRREK